MPPWMIPAAYIGAGIYSSAMQAKANYDNLKFQKGVNDTSIRLADTAHQRETMDLMAAGLNPVLSASTSGSAVPTLGATDIKSVGEGLSSGIENATKAASLDVPLKESQVAVNSAQAINLANQGELFAAQAEAIRNVKDGVGALRGPAEEFGAEVGEGVGEYNEMKRSMSAKKATSKTHVFDPKRGRYVPIKKGN